ncbi:hypothetical protein NBRC116493_17100 [Aurantivibrio infirmus]
MFRVTVFRIKVLAPFVKKVAIVSCLFLVSGFVSGVEQLDPTKPLEYVFSGESQPKTLQLNSILISSGRKIAVINGEKVEVNGVVGNVRVAEIRSDFVIVYRDGEKIELKLYGKKLRENTTNRVSER